MANMNTDVFSSIISETRVLREGLSANKRKAVAPKTTKRIVKESARRAKRVLEDDELAPVEDQVIAVVDPELDADSDTAELQEIVDDAPEGEVPVVDDYVDDHVYQCSICGNSFFSDEEITENPIVCPVCGEEADVVAQGVVEETNDDEDATGDFDEEPAVDDAEAPEIIDDETAVSEKFKRPATRKRVAESAKFTGYMFDDARMSALMTKYMTENYKNIKSAKCVAATVAPTKSKTKTLTLECIVTYKSGKKAKARFVAEGLILSAPRVAMKMKESTQLFSKKMVESRSKTPFVLECVIAGKSIAPAKLKYNYVIKEGKSLYSVSGSPRIVG